MKDLLAHGKFEKRPSLLDKMIDEIDENKNKKIEKEEF